jgi:hypothetical protein
VQLLDWLYALRARADLLRDDQSRLALVTKIQALVGRLANRGADAATLQPEVAQLESEIAHAEGAPQVGVDRQFQAQAELERDYHKGDSLEPIKHVLRVLVGVAPLSLRSVYDWMLPALVLITLVALLRLFLLFNSTAAEEQPRRSARAGWLIMPPCFWPAWRQMP